ncbi:MAG TPA: metallophosphoesterase [Anaerolineales bacterium]
MIDWSKRIAPSRVEDWVEITQVRLELPNLPPEFHGYRLVQISDFHIGTWMSRVELAQAVGMVNRLKPDLVAITGDFVTEDPECYVDDLAGALSKLSSKDGVFAVLGNHDHWTDPTVMRRALRLGGVSELCNTFRTLQRGAACLHIAGVDCSMVGLDRLDQVLERLPAQGGAVLLAHEPDFADRSAASRRFDLQISGHSHGGQVCLPLVGPLFLPRCARKYPSGFYRVGGMILYTNRGLGTAKFQLRINCPPEITVFTLESPGQARGQAAA